MYAEHQQPTDPYTDNRYAQPPPPTDAPAPDVNMPPARGRSRSPYRQADPAGDQPRRRSPPPKRPGHAPVSPEPTSVLGVFGLSIRTQERDLEEEFNRWGRVEKVTIVYDQRSDRSRGFGFISMASIDDATRCIKELNGVDLNGRRIRVDYSVTDRAHAPTPGQYMGHRRPNDTYRGRDSYSSRRYEDDRNRDGYGRDRDWRDRDGRDYRGEYRDRDREYRDREYRDSYRDRDYRDRDRDDRNRDPYGREREWRERDRRSPRSRYSPDRRRSRSPGARAASPRRDYDANGAVAPAPQEAQPRW